MRTSDKVTGAPPRPRTIGLFEALGFFAPYGQRPCIEIVQPWTSWADLIVGAEDELHAGALALARRGLRVFPVWASRVEGDASSGKIPIPRGWNQKATTDESQINIWWREQWRHKDRIVYTPGANVGIACGEASNLTVVDLDDRPEQGRNGPAALADLEARHGALPPGPVVCRGTSRHLYFQHVQGLRNANGVLPGVDLKVDGGYIVAPPSIHRTGMRYRWAEGTEHLPLPMMPPWLVEIFTPKPKERRARHLAAESTAEQLLPMPSEVSADTLSKPNPTAKRKKRRSGLRPASLPPSTTAYAAAALRAEAGNVAAAKEGTRNSTLNTAAFALGTLVGAGSIDRADVEQALLDAALKCGLPDEEAERTITSGLDAGEREPRDLVHLDRMPKGIGFESADEVEEDLR